jgi:hypothetical protein
MVAVRLAALAFLFAALVGSAVPVLGAAATNMTVVKAPLDQERVIDGVSVGCTGIGQSKNEPRWLGYSVRLEFSDPTGAYLANEVVAVSDARGRRLVAVSCEGPWILLRLPPGEYQAKGWLPNSPGQPVSASFRAPARGQLRRVLQFPNP